jgi:hypothetical protein
MESTPLAAPTHPPISSPVTSGTLLSGTFRVWKERFGPFAAVMLTFQLPALLFQWAVGSPFLAGGGGFGKATPEAQAFVQTGRYWAIVAVGMAMWALQLAAVTAGALEHLAGRRASFGEMVASGLRRIGPVVLAGALAMLASALGTVLLIIPGIIVSLMFCLVVPVAIAERLSLPKILGRSRALTKGYRNLLGGFLVIVAIIEMIPGLAVAFVGGGVPYLSTLLGTALNAVIGSLLVVAPAVAYHDLKRLKEGANTAQLERVFE